MYEDFFGLTDQPFQLSTDPDYLFLSASHARAFAYLKYALCRRDGIVTITGGIGTGKSTLISSVCAQAAPEADVVVLHQTQLDEVQLLQAMLFGMGLAMVPTSKAELLDNARALLHARHQQGRLTTLIVDDAHNLSATALEELRMLADMEHDNQPLLSLVLVGQPGLRRTLARPGLEQLRQRIRLNYRLEPLSSGATRRYVCHRLKIAGNTTLDIFPLECDALIYRYTGGVPRRINLLCDMAMTAASLGKRRSVTPQCIIDAAQELGWPSRTLLWRSQQAWRRLRARATLDRLAAPIRRLRTQPQWPAEHGGYRQALRDGAAAASVRLRAVSRATAESAAKAGTQVRRASRSAALGAAAVTALAGNAIAERWQRQRPLALVATALPVLLMPLAVLSATVLEPAGNAATAADTDVISAAPAFVAQANPPATTTIVVPAAYRTDEPPDEAATMGPPAPSSSGDTPAAPASATDAANGETNARIAAAPGPTVDLSSQGLRPAEWILDQQPDAYTIQILGTHRPGSLKRFIARHAGELDLAYFTVERNERDWFVLVAGNYASFSAARQASRELPEAIRSNGPWVRRFAEIQTAIGDTSGAGQSVRVDSTAASPGAY